LDRLAEAGEASLGRAAVESMGDRQVRHRRGIITLEPIVSRNVTNTRDRSRYGHGSTVFAEGRGGSNTLRVRATWSSPVYSVTSW
jgi:hypothetical protein